MWNGYNIRVSELTDVSVRCFVQGYFRVGTALKGLGRYAEAKVALEKALELQPGHAPTQALLEVCVRACFDVVFTFIACTACR